MFWHWVVIKSPELLAAPLLIQSKSLPPNVHVRFGRKAKQHALKMRVVHFLKKTSNKTNLECTTVQLYPNVDRRYSGRGFWTFFALSKVKPKEPFLKKYCNPKKIQGLELHQIRTYGRQILEVRRGGGAFHRLVSVTALATTRWVSPTPRFPRLPLRGRPLASEQQSAGWPLFQALW